MGRLMALVGAALAALLFSRRKTLKEDGQLVTAKVKDGASKVTERVRGGSKPDSTGDEANAEGDGDGEERESETEATPEPETDGET